MNSGITSESDNASFFAVISFPTTDHLVVPGDRSAGGVLFRSRTHRDTIQSLHRDL